MQRVLSLVLRKSKIIYAYTCIYTGDSGNMHRKMVIAAALTRGNECLGGGVSINGGKEHFFHNLNPFEPLKLCTVLTNFKTEYQLQTEHS